MGEQIVIPMALVILGLLIVPFMIMLIDLGFAGMVGVDAKTQKRKVIATIVLGLATMAWLIYLGLASGMISSIRLGWLP